jgi:hypothetical protein
MTQKYINLTFYSVEKKLVLKHTQNNDKTTGTSYLIFSDLNYVPAFHKMLNIGLLMKSVKIIQCQKTWVEPIQKLVSKDCSS